MAGLLPDGNDEPAMERVLTCPSVRFAHAVNSSQRLDAALLDPAVNWIEADVILGEPVRGGTRLPLQPVMGA